MRRFWRIITAWFAAAWRDDQRQDSLILAITGLITSVWTLLAGFGYSKALALESLDPLYVKFKDTAGPNYPFDHWLWIAVSVTFAFNIVFYCTVGRDIIKAQPGRSLNAQIFGVVCLIVGVPFPLWYYWYYDYSIASLEEIALLFLFLFVTYDMFTCWVCRGPVAPNIIRMRTQARHSLFRLIRESSG